MANRLTKLVKNNLSFLLFIALMFVFRSAVADWNQVPTGSMKPTILAGDRILVNKMAYDVRLPFTLISLLKIADPARGDIIIFDSDTADKRLVKRVIGIPGDTVAMNNNVLYINGNKLHYQTVASTLTSIDQSENLLGLEHRVRINPEGSRLASFKPVTVPAKYYLALGDNRDNSADSRVIGFVPRHEIVGRSNSVVLSFNYDNFYLPRSDRFFQSL